VSADWIAILHVSRSRISPIMITSGSWRTIERRAPAKSNPIWGFTCIWLTPSSWYSTGSSTVMILRSGVLIFDSAVYSVVVLPEPVGPVTSRIPFGCSSTRRKGGSVCSSKPSESKSRTTLPRSRMRITTDSPKLVGMHDTRRSSSLPCTRSMMRPSCGRRRLHLVQYAVDAVAHLQAILERLDVDVRGARFHRALDQQVHQPDHRRF